MKRTHSFSHNPKEQFQHSNGAQNLHLHTQMTHERPRKIEKYEVQNTLTNPTCTVKRQTPVCESMGVSNKRLNLNLRSSEEDKEKHTHKHTEDKGNLFPWVEKAEKGRFACAFTQCACVSVCTDAEASAWRLIIVRLAVRNNHNRLSVNIVDRCHCKHWNYLLISLQLCTHLCSRLPLPHLSSPITPPLTAALSYMKGRLSRGGRAERGGSGAPS